MTSSARLTALFALIASLWVAACAPEAPTPDSGEVTGADEETATSEEGLSGSVAVGTELVTTAGVNLRSGPSTNRSILHVVPEGSTVLVRESAPKYGFYFVRHSGVNGWVFGTYLRLASDGGSNGGDDDGGDGTDMTDDAPSSNVRDAAIERAKAGVGFSYWWGHGRLRAEGPTSSTKGSCSGSCPDCSHSGQYGADCSGYAAKVWQVPGSNTSLSTDWHPYSTADFHQNTSQWSAISRGNVKKADMLVYRSGGAGHIFVYEKGDAWGSMYAYECKGCSAGCIAGYRTASSAYKTIRKKGW